MQFSIDPKILESYPSIQIGVIECLEVDNLTIHPSVLSLLRGAEELVRSTIPKETFKDHPKIKAWADAHRAFGSNPNRDQPSIQALVKRVVNGGSLPQINTLVDLYNVISLKYLLPAGGEDLDQIKGEIQLTYAKGDEEFMEIGATAPNLPQSGEVIYRDEVGVICRKFNWREADRTKLTQQTTNAVLVLETLPPMSKAELGTALEELATLLRSTVSGKIKVSILGDDKLSL